MGIRPLLLRAGRKVSDW